MHAIAAAELTRLPDLVLRWGSAFDTLAARLAEVAKEGGSDKLAEVLKRKHTPQEVFAAAPEALTSAPRCESYPLSTKRVLCRHPLFRPPLGRGQDGPPEGQDPRPRKGL